MNRLFAWIFIFFTALYQIEFFADWLGGRDTTDAWQSSMICLLASFHFSNVQRYAAMQRQS